MVTVSLLAGSEPAVRPVFHFGMDIEDATQTLGRTDEQHPWLEYSVWQVGADLYSAVAPRRSST